MDTLFPERLTRLQYLVRGGVWSILQVPIEIYFFTTDSNWTFGQFAAVLLLLIFLAYSLCYLAIPRATDIGLSRSTALILSLIPCVNFGFGLFLLFTKTDAYASKQIA